MDKAQGEPSNEQNRGLPEEASGASSADEAALEAQGSAAEGTMNGSPDPLQDQAEEMDPSTQFGSSKSDMYRGVPGDRISG